MARGPDADRIGDAARRLLESGAVGDDELRASAKMGVPLLVVTPAGKGHSWFVPFVVGESLAAFLQLLSDGTFMRFSSFQRGPGRLEGLPMASDWLDVSVIRERASTLARPGEHVATPVLTFDRDPSRLVWSVTLTTADGASRAVFVAGATAFPTS